MRKSGKIIIPSDANVWPHELQTAKALSKHGYTVVFRKKSEGYKVQSADATIEGILWEFKAPKGHKLAAVERNLRIAKDQSSYIVFDSLRMKDLPDSAIKREILAKAPHISRIKEIRFIDRNRRCIDIYKRKK